MKNSRFRRIFYRVYILFAQRDDPLRHLNESDDAGGKAKRPQDLVDKSHGNNHM